MPIRPKVIDSRDECNSQVLARFQPSCLNPSPGRRVYRGSRPQISQISQILGHIQNEIHPPQMSSNCLHIYVVPALHFRNVCNLRNLWISPLSCIREGQVHRFHRLGEDEPVVLERFVAEVENQADTET